jgi:hypothetical protein
VEGADERLHNPLAGDRHMLEFLSRGVAGIMRKMAPQPGNHGAGPRQVITRSSSAQGCTSAVWCSSIGYARVKLTRLGPSAERRGTAGELSSASFGPGRRPKLECGTMRRC